MQSKQSHRDRILYSDKGRKRNSRHGSPRRRRSITPVGRTRQRYPYYRSRSPDAYKEGHRNINHTFDRLEDKARHRHAESRMLSRTFTKFDYSPDRPYIGDRSYRFDHKRGNSPVIHRGKCETSDQSGDAVDRSPFTPFDERRNYDSFDDTPNHLSLMNEEGEYSNSSNEYLTQKRYKRQSFSSLRSEDEHFEMQYELEDIQYRRECHDMNDTPTDYWTRNRETIASSFERTPNVTCSPRTPDICKFYNNEGTCNKGNSCKFLHVCKYFINDDCKFGKGCKRSHNLLDQQPRSILEKYDMIPDQYIITEEIMDSVKEKLKNPEFKSQGDNISKTLNHNLRWNKWTSILESEDIMDASSSMSDSSERKGMFDKEKHSQSSADFIPLEITKKNEQNAKTKRKKRSKRSKKDKNGTSFLRKVGVETNNLMRSEDRHESTAQSIITIESTNPYRKAQIRKHDDGWQILKMNGIWVDLNKADSESFGEMYNEMYNKVLEIGEKSVGIQQE